MNSIRGKPSTALFVVSFAVFVDLMVYGLIIPVLPGYASKPPSTSGVSQSKRSKSSRLERGFPSTTSRLASCGTTVPSSTLGS
jgi:hypothetical protein